MTESETDGRTLAERYLKGLNDHDPDLDITLDVTPGVPHGFQAFAAILDEGDAALARTAAFLDQHLSWAETTV